ncbi:hypothetical protein [Flavobacterium sp.]|uniref:hypothetical protein n=1 Tax=Flavobacterium sp. TaxID=239 RepID=UPI0025E71CFF|nr:hypothetical protein [Flavobacterium sp.]
MLNFFSPIILFLFSFCCNSQKLIVQDAKTKKTISFVNYFLYQDEKLVTGGYCSEDGVIQLNSEILFNKIKLSCIGYENLEISKNIINNDTLLLTPAVYPLKEVVVKTNKKDEFVNLGYIKSKRKTWLTAIKGMKICAFIDNPFHETKLIHSFLFKICNNNSTKLGFKLHLFEKDSLTNNPGKELLKQDIIVILDGKSNKDIENIISQYNIDFPAQGAFVGIEWFGVLNEENNDFKDVDSQNGYIEINDDAKEFSTFQKDVFSFYPWKNMEKFKKLSEEYTSFKNCPTASFGIKIYKI